MINTYKKSKLLLLLVFSFSINIFCQNFIGAGNSNGISVYSSNENQNANWTESAKAENTINGKGLDYNNYDAARFLTQSTLGFEKSHINEVVNIGKEQWIENQTNLPISYTYNLTNDFYAIAIDSLIAAGDSLDESDFRPRWNFFSFAWWHQNTLNEDLLRHRIATALSQIFVVSLNSDLSGHGDGLAHYYDMLLEHSFGNYEELLLDVALHPAMGYYLSHLNNPKTDTTFNIRPDENFAREIMQLFSIGLYQLNLDGTYKTDINNELIPTYGQFEIKELAKVFTGLSTGGAVYTPYDSSLQLYFGKSIYSSDLTEPMIMFEWQHEKEAKTLVGGKTIAGGQPGMVDIEQAVKHLANHPNVPPFISKLLIQRLVKSNPTSAYIKRVASVFVNNGKGERGDLKAVVKAILLDEEARNCENLNDDKNSKMKEPLLRYTHFTRAIDKNVSNGLYWNIANGFLQATGQAILSSPTVFNFFLPNYAPNGEIKDEGLVAPEFQLHNSKSGLGYLNEARIWTSNPNWSYLMTHWETGFENNKVVIDIDNIKELTTDTEAFINEVDKLFTCGQMTEQTRQVIRTAFNDIPISTWYDYKEFRTSIGLYLVLISPDYVIMR